jgi:hypothetical protein
MIRASGNSAAAPCLHRIYFTAAFVGIEAMILPYDVGAATAAAALLAKGAKCAGMSEKGG